MVLNKGKLTISVSFGKPREKAIEEFNESLNKDCDSYNNSSDEDVISA
jgi:hypothetical protein